MKRFIFLLLMPLLTFAATVEDVHSTNDMTTQGNCFVTSGGIIGDCTEYDNLADWMECPDANDLDLEADFTIQVWAYARTLAGSGTDWFVMKKTDAGVTDAFLNYALQVGGSANKLVLTIGDGTGSTNSNSQQVIITGSWFHIVVAFDYSHGASTANFYVNNNKTSIANTRNPAGNAYELIVGKHSSSGGGSDFEWDGWLDEIAIWKGRLLSDSDVTTLYNSGSGITYGDFTSGMKTSLVAYWSHDPLPTAGQVIMIQM